MALFNRGYEEVQEEKKRQDVARENAGKRLWRFFISNDGEEATVRFLTEEPVTFYEHTVKVMRGGKERYDNVICTKDAGGCTLCDSGDRPSFKGAYLVYDKRPYEYTDKDGKKKVGKGQLRLYVQGTRVLSQLDRLSSRYGLTNRDYVITRTGSGTSTTYMFDRGDDVSKLSEAEITNMLPEKLREMYNGTEESLYAIVENQLEMLLKEGADTDYETVEETSITEDSSSSAEKNLISYDDEENEEEASKKPAVKKLLGKKPRENSAKSLVKKFQK